MSSLTTPDHRRETARQRSAIRLAKIGNPDHDASSAEVFVLNIHRNFTGVSATANGVVSHQLSQHPIRLVGGPLPLGPEPISLRQAISLCRKPPQNRPFAIWHVRRNVEMLAALFARDVLRLPIRIVLTSAAQRRHSLLPRMLISHMDAVVATLPAAAAFVPHVAAVVPHGVDVDRFTPAESRDRAWAAMGYPGRYGIGIVGRIRPEKGTDLFVETMLRVLPQRPEYTALIIGCAKTPDAGFERRLRAKIKNAGLEDRCLFVGEIPPNKMPELMRGLSLLVAPPRYEGYGMTPLEAMASGAAVVATDTGAFAEMIRGDECGQIVPVGDIESLVRAVLSVTNDPIQLATMGRAARRRAVERFSIAGEVGGIGRVYEQLWSGQRFK